MKTRTRIAFLALSAFMLLGSTAFLVAWSIHRSAQNENIVVYSRFYTADSSGTHFNPWALLSPIQVESQKINYDTVRFSVRVPYPYGKDFQCVAPNDSSAEMSVAQQIANTLNDSIDKIKENIGWDYDGQSAKVRAYAQPRTIILVTPTPSIDLFGTASPEATKYGFRASLQPGARETENLDLASLRVNRTGAILVELMKDSRVDSIILRRSSDELQLADSNAVEQVMQDSSILDSMRYVQADAVVPVERLEITTTTSPVILPLWLAFLTFLLPLLWNLIPTKGPRKVREPRPLATWEDLGMLWWLLKVFTLVILGSAVAAIIITTIMYLVDPRVFLFLLAAAALIGIICAIYTNREAIWNFLANAGTKFLKFWAAVGGLIASFWRWLKRTARKFWKGTTTCQKLLILMTAYALFATYMWLSSPC